MIDNSRLEIRNDRIDRAALNQTVRGGLLMLNESFGCAFELCVLINGRTDLDYRAKTELCVRLIDVASCIDRPPTKLIR